MRAGMKRPRLVFVLRLALTGLALWLMALALIDGYGQQNHARPADVIVVLDRTDLLFRRAGVVAYTSPAQITGGPMKPVERYVQENRELAALLWYWVKMALGVSATDFW